MTDQPIRPAFHAWPEIDRRLRTTIAALTDEQLALRPGPDRWPLWATVGHLACQRVFWLCDFAGEPGAATTRFTNAGHDCPGDDDLETVLDAPTLVDALESTFRIVEATLDRWTLADLDGTIRREDFGPDWVHTRGAVIARVYTHDVAHVAEVNEILGANGLPLVDLWV
jgi:hypothetical protein